MTIVMSSRKRSTKENDTVIAAGWVWKRLFRLLIDSATGLA